MRKLLVWILVPILSMYFVSVKDYEQKIDEFEARISMLEGQTVVETEYNDIISVESTYYTIEIVIEDGWLTEIKVCVIETGKCEINIPNEGQEEQYTIDDREYLISELINYGETLDNFWEYFN